nr:response regulator [Pseudenhygromyxa sp. WMMC2535]
MLVDDEPDIRTIAQMSLAHVGGWETFLATCGQEAIALASRHKPDVIILDVMMPEMDGVETFKALAAQAETRDIPVIFMTAKVQTQERERYVGLGAAGVIAKPFDPMRLPEEVKSIFAQPAKQRGRNRMDALRKRYAEGLGAKLDGLRAAVDTVRTASAEDFASAVETAHRTAHTLHGTAGTYGYQAVSEAMAQVEAALERLGQASDEASLEACWQAVDASLEAAARASDA